MTSRKKMIALAAMPIDVSKESVYRFADIGKHLPYRPGYQTVWNWAFKGRDNFDGKKRCFLEKIFLPQGWSTSIEAYHRFVAELNRGR